MHFLSNERAAALTLSARVLSSSGLPLLPFCTSGDGAELGQNFLMGSGLSMSWISL